MEYHIKLLTEVAIFAMLAISLNVIVGLAGMLQLGHAGFYAVGAYAAGLLAIYATVPAWGAWNLLLGCCAAVAAAGAIGALLALPCLRLRGDYLAIVTLGFGEILRMTLNNVEFPGCALTGGESFGGATGINLPTPVLYDVSYSADYASPLLIWIVLAGGFVMFLNLKRSAFGRAMLCLREDEIAARAMGISVPKTKLYAFVLSAGVAGLAGALMIHNRQIGLTATPQGFDLFTSIEVLLMVVLGGMGSLTGSLLAAAVLVYLPELPRFLPALGGVDLAEKRQLIYAVLLIVLIRLVPDGLLGMRELPRWLTGLAGRTRRGRVP